MNGSDDWNTPSVATTTSTYGGATSGLDRPLPAFCKTIAIIDLVMASIRLLIVPLSIIGFMVLEKDDPLINSVYFEIGFGVLIGVFGIIAAIGMLMRKSWAVPAGWINIGVTFPGIFVGIWQGAIMVSADPTVANDPASQAGAFVGIFFAVGIRLTLLVLVVVALVKYKAWLAQRG